MGFALMRGHGVRKDHKRAHLMFKEAIANATLRDSKSVHLVFTGIATLYHNGYGVPMSLREAKRNLQRCEATPQ